MPGEGSIVHRLLRREVKRLRERESELKARVAELESELQMVVDKIDSGRGVMSDDPDLCDLLQWADERKEGG